MWKIVFWANCIGLQLGIYKLMSSVNYCNFSSTSFRIAYLHTVYICYIN